MKVRDRKRLENCSENPPKQKKVNLKFLSFPRRQTWETLKVLLIYPKLQNSFDLSYEAHDTVVFSPMCIETQFILQVSFDIEFQVFAFFPSSNRGEKKVFQFSHALSSIVEFVNSNAALHV